MERLEWRRATDVFAIEVADMKDAHVTLIGGDPTEAVRVQPGALRLQAEREMRAKLIHLHGGMLISAEDPPRLGELLLRALPSFTTYLRTALRLSGSPVPAASTDVIVQGCALVGTDSAAFLEVLDARKPSDGPVARCRFDHGIPFGFHGLYLPNR